MPEPRNHVFIVDGTLSRLDDEDCMTHAGRLYRMLAESQTARTQSLGYDQGIQGSGLSKWVDAAVGRGFNRNVFNGYATLASRYRAGDRIYLFGYSRGAYAVRCIAGMIDRIGLLRQECATHRRVKQAFRAYQHGIETDATRAFRREYCHEAVDIACIGVWDTVKALGLPYPMLARFFPVATGFHNNDLGKSVSAAFQALAADEDRTSYAPVLWERGGWQGQLQQAWFPGAHGDVGGERGCLIQPIPFTNLSFVWLIQHAVEHGLIVPENWRKDFPTDTAAPMVGARRGINRLFLIRRPREAQLGQDGQNAHHSINARSAQIDGYSPLARGLSR